MNTRATQITILQMAGNAVTLLNDDAASASTLPQMILTAEECTMKSRWEETDNNPDREEQFALLIRAAANCIRAAATLVGQIDPVEFARMQLELVKCAYPKHFKPHAKALPSDDMPPVMDFIENHNLERN